MSGQYEVVLIAGVTQVMLNISVFEDDIREEQEQFHLMIIAESLPSRVKRRRRSQALVNITDTTGKLACRLL